MKYANAQFNETVEWNTINVGLDGVEINFIYGKI